MSFPVPSTNTNKAAPAVQPQPIRRFSQQMSRNVSVPKNMSERFIAEITKYKEVGEGPIGVVFKSSNTHCFSIPESQLERFVQRQPAQESPEQKIFLRAVTHAFSFAPRRNAGSAGGGAMAARASMPADQVQSRETSPVTNTPASSSDSDEDGGALHVAFGVTRNGVPGLVSFQAADVGLVRRLQRSEEWLAFMRPEQ